MHTKLLSRTMTVACFALVTTLAQAQTWTTLNNLPPFGVTSCLLLTDGGVMCQSDTAWYKLTPDLSGSYQNGTWSSLASFPSGYDPLLYASAVLPGGRVVVVGGEYNFGVFSLTNMGAVYNPETNTWKMLTPPAASDFQCIGNSPATVLQDGRFMIGAKLFKDLAVLDPTGLTWANIAAPGPIMPPPKNDINAEEGWTLLPDNSVLTVDVTAAPAAERFVLTAPLSTTGAWVSAGTTPTVLTVPFPPAPIPPGPPQAPGCPSYTPAGQMGPSVLLPNGKVFTIGANGSTAIFTPPSTWIAGPPVPGGLNVEDGPAALLPNGHVIFGASPGLLGMGLQYFEFDGTSTITALTNQPLGALYDATYFTQLLVLPTGQALFIDSSTRVQLYTPASSPSPAYAPTIATVPGTLENGTTYTITGTQFNGVSQATAYGPEMQNATNYPLVRITNTGTGDVFYARTHDHSTMGVATGSQTVSTKFDVPANIEAGPSTIQVVANGIPSATKSVTVTTPNPMLLTITTTSLPAGQVNVPYTATLSATGGKMAYSWTLTSGTLPAGLFLDSSTGVISGTPTSAARRTPLTFQVTDSSTPVEIASVSLTLTINPSVVSITTTSLPNGQVGVPYAAVLSAAGGIAPYGWQLTSGTLPNGLVLNPATGQISGTPTIGVASTPLTFQVSDSSSPVPETASATLYLTITSSSGLTITTTSLPTGVVNVFYSALLSATGGTTPYTWQQTSGTLPPGLTLTPSNGQISGTPTSPVASTPLTFKVTDSSSPAQTMTVNLSLTITSASGLTITTTSLPTGEVNVPYSALLTAVGGTTPYAWSTRRLPGGLVLNPQSGQISGTPSAPVPTTSVTFSVTDSSMPPQTLSISLNLTINAATPGLTITTTFLPSGQLSVPYNVTLSATGGTTPYSWQLISGSLPTGLTLTPSTGQISGTPTMAVANTPLTFQVTDSSSPAQTTSVNLSLTISSTSPGLTITTTSLPDGQAGVPYSATLTAVGGTTPYTWTTRRLPGGLFLNSQTGQISGTPTASQMGTTVTFTVTDSTMPNPQTLSISLTLNID